MMFGRGGACAVRGAAAVAAMKSRRVWATGWILYHGRQVLPLTLGLLIVCGSSEVLIVDTANENRVVWRWRAADRPELPAEVRPLFKYTADCKPVNGGRHIIVASSSDGVALVERATGRVEAWASVPNAHSADVLADGRIVVASSSRGRSGDHLVVFAPGMPMKELRRIFLYSAHGVVWDPQRDTVWAVGIDSLNAYDSKTWAVRGEWRLPDPRGHDLYPVPGSPALAVTTSNICLLFDRDRKAFEPHPLIGLKPRVKSYSQDGKGRIAFVQSIGDSWWGTRIGLLNPDGEVSIGEMKLYKARWLTTGEARLPSVP